MTLSQAVVIGNEYRITPRQVNWISAHETLLIIQHVSFYNKPSDIVFIHEQNVLIYL